jgi:hypothetical protein
MRDILGKEVSDKMNFNTGLINTLSHKFLQINEDIMCKHPSCSRNTFQQACLDIAQG